MGKYMKTVKKEGQYRRVKNDEINGMLKNGWVLCPKKEWKNTVRDVNGKVEIMPTPKKVKVVSDIPTVREIKKAMEVETSLETKKNKQPKKGKKI